MLKPVKYAYGVRETIGNTYISIPRMDNIIGFRCPTRPEAMKYIHHNLRHVEKYVLIRRQACRVVYITLDFRTNNHTVTQPHNTLTLTLTTQCNTTTRYMTLILTLTTLTLTQRHSDTTT